MTASETADETNRNIFSLDAPEATESDQNSVNEKEAFDSDKYFQATARSEATCVGRE